MAKEFKGKLECLGKNTEKYITFSVAIKKKLDNGKTIMYKLKIIDSFIFMIIHYQNLLMTYLKFIKKNAKDAWKEKESNQSAILLVLTIIDYVTDGNNVKENG